MSNRGRPQPIRNPAEAIAMAKCWLNTWARAGYTLIGNPDSFHGSPCVYCEVPRDYLIMALEEFRDWSKISEDIEEGTPLRLEIEQWQMLPTEEQQRLVEKAQVRRNLEIPAEVNDWWNQDEP